MTAIPSPAPTAAPSADTAGALASMTAFARASGTAGAWRFAWELRSVNGKGFDLRLRLPPGFDFLESDVRALAAGRLTRGSVSATLTTAREGENVTVRVNRPALEALFAAVGESAKALGVQNPGIDSLLSVKGIVEVSEVQESEADLRALGTSISAGFSDALDALGAMRVQEGEALRAILLARLDGIATLVEAAEALPERALEAIKARLAEQVRTLSEASVALDPDRLHQEAVLLATKADVREELDRLAAHLAQARDLIAKGGPVGRRLDFLAQEFNREANTLCSKSNSVALTQIGLDLKLLVDQFREQIQNVE